MVRTVYNLNQGNPVIVEQDTYLFTAIKEGASAPYTTKAFQFGRGGDSFTLQNAGGTGGASTTTNNRFVDGVASPNKRWFAVASQINTGADPAITIWENNFDGTMSFAASFSGTGGLVNSGASKLIFSPDSTKLFAVGSGATSQVVLQYIKLTGSTWASQSTMTATTLTMSNPNSISHHPTDDKLLIMNLVAGEAIHEVTYDATSFGTPSELINGVSNRQHLQPRYSPNGEYIMYMSITGTISPYTREIRLHKIGVGLVDTLDVSSVVEDRAANAAPSDAAWFADSSHIVFAADVIGGSGNTNDGLLLIKRTGDTLSLEQTIDYTSDAPNITNISLTQDTFPLLAIGAGDPRADTGGWVVSAVRQFLRTLKFNSGTGLFDTTPIQNFTEGNVAAFAPPSTYPAP